MVATLEELERRVLALEQAHNENTTTLKWMAGTLGEIKGVVDESHRAPPPHRGRFKGHQG